MDLKDQEEQLNIEKMGERRRRRRNMKSSSCLSPMSMLERFREAVFRLIMITALSKSARDNQSENAQRAYYPPDQHHNDAVADCIEFIKKSALTEEGNCDSSSCVDGSNEVNILPALPVM
ncbi:hypothetical protein GIB67_005367 [Kingdonia uniflora]|uniref:Uncharacterized protein n=1 Tax=Kingdonia uniflora TaxID=39325 RepID=A0A7J7NH46_9MAGN|nr:hypothetical protein GIB67_005367 [Kingdonia uniflora]